MVHKKLNEQMGGAAGLKETKDKHSKVVSTEQGKDINEIFFESMYGLQTDKSEYKSELVLQNNDCDDGSIDNDCHDGTNNRTKNVNSIHKLQSDSCGIGKQSSNESTGQAWKNSIEIIDMHLDEVANKIETNNGLIDWEQISTKNNHMINIAKQVIDTGQHNSDIEGLHIEINKNWNVQALQTYLQDYHDKQIIDYIKYGWSANRSMEAGEPELSDINHKGATEFEADIDKYLAKEIENGRMAGPYNKIPFDKGRLGLSPLNSHPKRDLHERRVIVDFSWPIGHAVNDGINKDKYMDTEITLKYPTIDTLAHRVVQLGVGSAVFKKDLKSAFRQLFGDPFDFILMLYKWKGRFFVDLAVAIGMRSAPSCYQRLTDAITYIHMMMGYWLMNYIDDFLGAEKWDKVWQSYHKLGELFREIGAQEAMDKASPPDTCVVCLGTMFNTLNMTISIVPDRLCELKDLLNAWRFKKNATRKQVESLIGKIQFITNCVRQGRIFVARLLNWLRAMPMTGSVSVPKQARLDILW